MSSYFSGNVKVYNEEFFVDANTGVGVGRVIAKIDPLLFKMSKSFYIQGYGQEDVKQELAIMALEGIRSYDSSKNVKLSTFLHIHLHNKIISKIRSQNKLSNNATSSLENSSLPDSCDCGNHIFMINEKNGLEVSRKCTSCDRVYKKEIRSAKSEVLFSQVDEKIEVSDQSSRETANFLESVAREDSIFPPDLLPEERMELEASILSVCSGIDEKTAQIIKMIALEDYSIKDAAEEVGISSWAANIKLKNLARNKKFRELLGM